MTPINYMSEQPADYAKALDEADTLAKLDAVMQAWSEFAADAYAAVQAMTEDDFKAWRADLRKERRGQFAGDAFAERYGALMMPEKLFKVSIVAMQYGVPWGCAYIRLRDSGSLEKALA